MCLLVKQAILKNHTDPGCVLEERTLLAIFTVFGSVLVKCTVLFRSPWESMFLSVEGKTFENVSSCPGNGVSEKLNDF